MSEQATQYIPREDFVLFRMTRQDTVRGLVMPQVSQQGLVRIVVAKGPNVKDLDTGDEVLVCGQVGSDVIALPNEPDLYLTRQANVLVIVRRADCTSPEPCGPELCQESP